MQRTGEQLRAAALAAAYEDTRTCRAKISFWQELVERGRGRRMALRLVVTGEDTVSNEDCGRLDLRWAELRAAFAEQPAWTRTPDGRRKSIVHYVYG